MFSFLEIVLVKYYNLNIEKFKYLCMKNLLKKICKKKGKFLIWYTGSRNQAEYVEFYSNYLKNNSILKPLHGKIIKNKSNLLPKTLNNYLFLDFPDIIIMSKENLQIIIGIEILEQKPVG